MYLFGGVYADLDMECLRPLDPLLAGRQALLAWMGPPDDHPHNVPNAWMASAPGHPFWLMMLTQIVLNKKDQAAEYVTGPVALKDAVARYWAPTNQTGLTILDPGVIYPFDWARSGARRRRRGALLLLLLAAPAKGCPGCAGRRAPHSRRPRRARAAPLGPPAAPGRPACLPCPADGDLAKYCRATFDGNPDFDADKCKALVPHAYTITYWRHSWEYSRRRLQGGSGGSGRRALARRR